MCLCQCGAFAVVGYWTALRVPPALADILFLIGDHSLQRFNFECDTNIKNKFVNCRI